MTVKSHEFAPIMNYNFFVKIAQKKFTFHENFLSQLRSVHKRKLFYLEDARCGQMICVTIIVVMLRKLEEAVLAKRVLVTGKNKI